MSADIFELCLPKIIRENKFLNQSGFTVVELLVTISIISLLASIILSSYNSVLAKARDAGRRSSLNQFTVALELYYDSYRAYPCGDFNSSFLVDGASHSGGTQDSTRSDGFLSVASVPGNCSFDPRFGLYPEFLSTSYPRDPINTNNSIYWYFATNNRQMYLLTAKLESDDDLMENDGGLCPLLYERGPGAGRIRPNESQIFICD